MFVALLGIRWHEPQGGESRACKQTNSSDSAGAGVNPFPKARGALGDVNIDFVLLGLITKACQRPLD